MVLQVLTVLQAAMEQAAAAAMVTMKVYVMVMPQVALRYAARVGLVVLIHATPALQVLVVGVLVTIQEAAYPAAAAVIIVLLAVVTQAQVVLVVLAMPVLMELMEAQMQHLPNQPILCPEPKEAMEELELVAVAAAAAAAAAAKLAFGVTMDQVVPAAVAAVAVPVLQVVPAATAVAVLTAFTYGIMEREEI
jgi:hypothetical protein